MLLGGRKDEDGLGRGRDGLKSGGKDSGGEDAFIVRTRKIGRKGGGRKRVASQERRFRTKRRKVAQKTLTNTYTLELPTSWIIKVIDSNLWQDTRVYTYYLRVNTDAMISLASRCRWGCVCDRSRWRPVGMVGSCGTCCVLQPSNFVYLNIRKLSSLHFTRYLVGQRGDERVGEIEREQRTLLPVGQLLLLVRFSLDDLVQRVVNRLGHLWSVNQYIPYRSVYRTPSNQSATVDSIKINRQ